MGYFACKIRRVKFGIILLQLIKIETESILLTLMTWFSNKLNILEW